MLWNESSRKTRSGTVFAAWLPQVTAFSATHFDFVLPLSCAVNAEGDDQDDHEPDDADELNQVDEEWPPNPLNDIDEDWPPRDPFNDVDDVPPPPLLKRRRSASYDDCVATGTPLSGPHCRRAAKRRRNIEREGHIPRESTIRDHVASAEPIIVPSFDASTLPTALGAYAARTENKAKKFGSKKRCSLAELLGLSFQLITWNGIDPIPLVDKLGRIFAVLAGQPRDDKYAAAVSNAYHFIKTQGAASHFPTSMRHHHRGLFAAINVGLTYGKGQCVPTWLDNKEYTGLAAQLLANKDIRRMAHFASSAFALWAPRLHGYYVAMLAVVFSL